MTVRDRLQCIRDELQQLFFDRTEVIDGALAARSPRVVANGRTFAYVLHEGAQTLRITQNDVRAIQLAKGALYAGARLLMMAPLNIFSPSSGKPIMAPTQDITLGCYYLTAEPREPRKDGRRLLLFGSKNEVLFAHTDGALRTHDRIRLATPTSAARRSTATPTSGSSRPPWVG